MNIREPDERKDAGLDESCQPDDVKRREFLREMQHVCLQRTKELNLLRGFGGRTACIDASLTKVLFCLSFWILQGMRMEELKEGLILNLACDDESEAMNSASKERKRRAELPTFAYSSVRA